MKDVMDEVSKALAPLSTYINELYGVREELCITKEFLQARYEKEKNPESKVVLSLAIRRLREQINKLDTIREEIFPDVQEATMKFASVMIKDALEEINRIHPDAKII